MGNTKSVPSIDRHDPRRPSYERRKLSKPRVGNHGGRRGILCFPVPSAIIGGRVSKAKNGIAQGINGAAPLQQTIQEWTNITDEKTEINTLKSWGPRTRHHSFSHSRHSSISHTRNASLIGSCRHSSLPLARYSSSRKSTLTSQDSKSDREANDLDRSHPPPSIMRRRSQILAAPPATKTRRQPTFALEGGLPVPQLLALNLAETDRAQTPSGYSVLGGFRRGSLRIVNASPAPSTQDSRPRRRNTSPAHPNASTHSLHMATSTPHLTITSDGNDGYFGYHGKLKTSNTILNGSPMPGQTHHRETLTPLSFETAPTEVPNTNEAPELPIHILPPIVDGLKVQRTSTPQGCFFKSSETPKTKASQQKNSPSIHASAQLAAHEPHLPLTSHQIAVSLDNSPIARSLSSSSSIYSSPPEHQPAGVNYPQRNAAGRPLAQTGTDSGYCSTGSVSSWSGEAGDGDLQQSCTNCSAGSVGRNSNANHVVSGTNTEQIDTDKRILQPKGLDERPLTFTDNYRIRATLEGPIVEGIVLSGRIRKPSLEIREHILAHKRSFTERLCSAVSSGDLESTTDQSIFSSIAKQQTPVSTREQQN